MCGWMIFTAEFKKHYTGSTIFRISEDHYCSISRTYMNAGGGYYLCNSPSHCASRTQVCCSFYLCMHFVCCYCYCILYALMHVWSCWKNSIPESREYFHGESWVGALHGTCISLVRTKDRAAASCPASSFLHSTLMLICCCENFLHDVLLETDLSIYKLLCFLVRIWCSLGAYWYA